jgi:hypothetical protein
MNQCITSNQVSTRIPSSLRNRVQTRNALPSLAASLTRWRGKIIQRTGNIKLASLLNILLTIQVITSQWTLALNAKVKLAIAVVHIRRVVRLDITHISMCKTIYQMNSPKREHSSTRKLISNTIRRCWVV